MIYFSPTDPFTVVTAANLMFDNKFTDVHIIDEIDRILKKDVIGFKQIDGRYHITGLAPSTHAGKVYALSATYSKYDEMFLKTCFGLTKVTKYQSQVEISTGYEMEPFNCTQITEKDANALNAKIVARFEADAMKYPFLLFEEE